MVDKIDNMCNPKLKALSVSLGPNLLGAAQHESSSVCTLSWNHARTRARARMHATIITKMSVNS